MRGFDYHFKVGDTIYRVERITISEWEEMQEITGLTIGQFNTGVVLMNPKCLRWLVWLARRRQDPHIRYSDVQFTMDEFDEVPDERPAGTDTAVESGKDEGPTSGPSAEAASPGNA